MSAELQAVATTSPCILGRAGSCGKHAAPHGGRRASAHRPLRRRWPGEHRWQYSGTAQTAQCSTAQGPGAHARPPAAGTSSPWQRRQAGPAHRSQPGTATPHGRAARRRTRRPIMAGFCVRPKNLVMSTAPATWDTHWARHWRLAWDYVLGAAVAGLLLACGACSPGRTGDPGPGRSPRAPGRRRRSSFEGRARGSDARSPRRREASEPDVDCSD